MILHFVVPGEPQAWQRAGRHGSRSFNPAEMAQAQKAVRQYADLAIREIKVKDPALWAAYPCSGPFTLRCGFHLGIDARGRKRDCDLDNLLKNVMDALRGLVWHDDIQVRMLMGAKYLASPQPRTVISAGPLETE